MNHPSVQEPNLWMLINFSPLLSKSQSFDEACYRKAKRMRLLSDQKSVYEDLNEKPQLPLNMNPTAVNDLYNNPVGFFLNQVNPDSGIYSDQNIVEIEGLDEIVPVNAFENPSYPTLEVNEEIKKFDLPFILNDVVGTTNPPPVSNPAAAEPKFTLPLPDVTSAELKRIFDSRKYSGFDDYFTTLKKVYPYIEKVRSKSQVYHSFRYHSKRLTDIEDKLKLKKLDTRLVEAKEADCKVIPPVPEGFDYRKEFRKEIDSDVNLYPSGAKFADAMIEKFPFITNIRTRTQISAFFYNSRMSSQEVTEKAEITPENAIKVNTPKGFEMISQAGLKQAQVAHANVISVSVPQGFSYLKEFRTEFELGKHLTPSSFSNAIKAKFPFIHSFRTEKQIRSWFSNRKTKQKPPSKLSCAEDLPALQNSQNSLEAFNEWLNEDRNVFNQAPSKSSTSSGSSSTPSCFPESPNIAESISTSSASPKKTITYLSSSDIQPQVDPEEIKRSSKFASTVSSISPTTAESPAEQTVPNCLSEYDDFFNTPAMKFLDNFFEETLFG